MADPLSIIAGVVGIGATAVNGISILSDVVDAVKNAPDEIAGISGDLRAFRTVVSSLESALRRKDVIGVIQEDDDLTSMVKDLEDPLLKCTTALNELTTRIKGHVKPSDNGKGSRFSSCSPRKT